MIGLWRKLWASSHTLTRGGKEHRLVGRVGLGHDGADVAIETLVQHTEEKTQVENNSFSNDQINLRMFQPKK